MEAGDYDYRSSQASRQLGFGRVTTLGTIAIRSPAPLGDTDLADLREKLAAFWRARFASSSVRADLETIRDG